MGDSLVTAVVTVLMAIVGVAIIAVLVSKNANTTGVIQAGSQGFSSSLATALSPVVGGGGGYGSFTGGGASYNMPSF